MGSLGILSGDDRGDGDVPVCSVYRENLPHLEGQNVLFSLIFRPHFDPAGYAGDALDFLNDANGLFQFRI